MRILPHRRLGLSSTPTAGNAEGDNQTFNKGDPIQIASGYVKAMSTVSVNSNTAIKKSQKIAGFVARDGKNNTNNPRAPFVPALPDVVFKGYLVHNTKSSAKIAQAQVGTSYPLVKIQNDSYFGVAIDSTKSNASVDTHVKVVELLDAIDTVNGRVGFIVDDSHRYY